MFCLLVPSIFLVVGCSTTPKITEAPKAQKIEKTAVQIAAEKRVLAWQSLIEANQNIPEDHKLSLVNDFINHLLFVDDIEHWHQNDYWATPLETVSTGGGDCEDFAIAKYFTLKYLHVAQDKMRITYVKALGINKPHMVLTYFLTPASEALVIDNLDQVIKLASQRTDLVPVYSFNTESLWNAKKLSSGEYVGNANRISLWEKLLEKMHKEEALGKEKSDSLSKLK